MQLKIAILDSFECHDIHTKFNENQGSGTSGHVARKGISS
jgi:hypothetical protein